ncbi:MAG: mRNA splicing protein [Vezdaea acicularis]|nr:MAG: mRNA splicing protein [Vezdaea acicularis]
MPPKPLDVSASNKERNEYIPSFISKKPFYVNDDSTGADYLEHQRLQREEESTIKWYDRGKRLGPAATKFRKGACENCGAMTHRTKECLSRPRKNMAKWTGRDIQADEVLQDVSLGWDAKRDRWNGYDSREYKHIIEEYEQLEQMKRRLKTEKDQKRLDEGDEDGETKSEEEAKYAEESDMGRNQSKSTRNLRIREDTARYLVNLDLDSAKYDPKTRSMVDSGAILDEAAALVAEDNFMRASGEAAEFEKAQKYAWESQERGDRNKQHIQANPTSGEYFRRKQQEEMAQKREAHRRLLLEKYGGEQHLQPTPLKDTGVIENERFVEYDELGGIRGAQKKTSKSKYKEDVLNGNHTTVWGSWWHNFEWGYQCCHSSVKKSYCTGEEGKRAWKEAHQVKSGVILENDLKVSGWTEEKREQSYPKSNLSREDGSKCEPVEVENSSKKKRPLEEMTGGIDETEMEEYRRKRAIANDPMAAFLGKDELVR